MDVAGPRRSCGETAFFQSADPPRRRTLHERGALEGRVAGRGHVQPQFRGRSWRSRGEEMVAGVALPRPLAEEETPQWLCIYFKGSNPRGGVWGRTGKEKISSLPGHDMFSFAQTHAINEIHVNVTVFLVFLLAFGPPAFLPADLCGQYSTQNWSQRNANNNCSPRRERRACQVLKDHPLFQ